MVNNKTTANQNDISGSQSQYSCEVLIDFRTYLCPPPKKNTTVTEINKVEVKIDKICAGKIIIGGTLYKTIIYTDITQCEGDKPNYIEQKDIAFSCYIDVSSSSEEDKFKIASSQIVCTFSEVIKEDDGCCEQSILLGKDIIKITVQRVTSSTQCKRIKKCKARHNTSQSKKKSCYRCSR